LIEGAYSWSVRSWIAQLFIEKVIFEPDNQCTIRMATNKLALIRYKTIDNCLRNRYRKWTLENLIEKVSDALYEYEGIKDGVSKRTIQADIQLMRSDKLGYNAPIVVNDRKYYTYADADYSISNSPINDADMEKMREVVSVLRQLNGFQYFEEMSDLVARLENTLQQRATGGRSHIQFEGNGQLKGLHFITPVHQAILRRVPLLIEYQSFKAAVPTQGVYYPYLLKEYRNRWFLIARPKKGKALATLALDRIVEVQEMAANGFVEYDGVDFERYYADTVGVTKSARDRGRKIVLWVHPRHAPYVLTKPLHASQELLKHDETGTIIRICVVLNFELERELLGFGENLKVLSPRDLQRRITRHIAQMQVLYDSESASS